MAILVYILELPWELIAHEEVPMRAAPVLTKVSSIGGEARAGR